MMKPITVFALASLSLAVMLPGFAQPVAAQGRPETRGLDRAVERANPKALSRLIADTDAKLTVAAGASAEEVAKMETVQTVLREASVDVASADIRALKTYQTMVDLMDRRDRQISARRDDDIARRNHIDFAA